MVLACSWVGVGLSLAASPIDSLSSQSQLTCESYCAGTLGVNIFPNGDFGSGVPNIYPSNPGIAPGYNYQFNPPPNDGWYCITNNTTSWGSFAASRWIKIEDNGPEPNGYMMVVNASYQPGLFYQKAVEVCELTTYEFSIDVINLFKSAFPSAIKPNLSFLIDGVEVCETGNIPSDEQWHTSRFSFTTAAGQTSLILSLRNNAPGGNGNDLAIDNISFRACGPGISLPDTVFFCPGTLVTLSPSFFNFPYSNPTYQWQMWGDSSWVNLSGAESPVLELPQAMAGQQFRLLVASAAGNLELPNCRVASTPIVLAYSYSLPVELVLDSIYCVGEVGAAWAVPSGGTAPYTYSWSNGTSGFMALDLEEGAYSVTVSDLNGCTGSSSVYLPGAPLADLSFLPQSVTCPGGADGGVVATVLGWSAGLSYQWSSGQTGSTLDSLVEGVYQLTVTNQDGCTMNGSVWVETLPGFEISLSSIPASCAQSQDGFAWVEVGGPGSPFEVLWENGVNTALNEALSAGWYRLTVTDSKGCSQLDSIFVDASELLQLSIQTDDVRCYGGTDGVATAQVTGGVPPYQFQYSNGAMGESAIQLIAGSYTLTVTDSLGCLASSSFTIQEPTELSLDTEGFSVSCFGSSDGSVTSAVNGGTPPYQFQWSNGSSTSAMEGLMAGAYSLTVNDVNGCTLIGQQLVASPDSLVLFLTGVSPLCFSGIDGSVEVNVDGGTPPYQYSWDNGSLDAAQSGVPSGLYSVRVQDANGCIKEGSVPLIAPEELQLTLTAEAESCKGFDNGRIETRIMGGVSPYQWHWSDGFAGQERAGLPEGTYRVTVTDQQGCTVVGEEEVFTLVTPLVDLGLDIQWDLGAPLVLIAQHLYPDTSLLLYQWEGIGGDTSCYGCSWLAFVPEQTGCQAVSISNWEGCVARDTICIEINTRKRLYIPNVFLPDKDGWNDFFTVYSDKSVKSIRRLSVYSRWGEEVFRAVDIPTNVEAVGWDGTFRGQNMLPGVYIYQVEVEFLDGETHRYSGDVTLVR